jgi:KUP system potassium uptake protein
VTSSHSPQGKSSLATLTLAALGVVFGDIGTSPLYAFKEAFNGPHGLPLNEANVLAVLSMVFWAVTLVVSLKYVVIVLRFDNGGEGGILALLARASSLARGNPRLSWTVAVLGIFGASLFFGDAVITPAACSRSRAAAPARSGGCSVPSPWCGSW